MLKTKLIAFSQKLTDTIIFSQKSCALEIKGSPLAFAEEVENLGVLRTARPGNMANLMLRISAHRSKLFSILPAGLAPHHRAKTSSCLMSVFMLFLSCFLVWLLWSSQSLRSQSWINTTRIY